MKTIKQWFIDTLPDDIAKQAIENTLEKYQSFETKNFTDAIMSAFYWSQTKQGSVFWNNIKEQYK